jgi:hypothetical protein
MGLKTHSSASAVRNSLTFLALEEIDAWQEYLQATTNKHYRYVEIEPWAWARLQQRRIRIRKRREALITR